MEEKTMTRNKLRSLLLTAAALTSLTALCPTALAGPPLICHPFEIGGAKSLPWGGSAWRDVKADYDLNRLVADTLGLLTSDTPVLVRMETLRRATVYAVWSTVDREVGYRAPDLRVANELLARLQARAQEARGKGQAEAMALFDLGYLAESYKQASHDAKGLSLAQGVDGYGAVVKAISLRGRDAEMEFAAAIIATHPQRSALREHLQRAVGGAADGSLLARNLVRHFGERGKTIAELRSSVGLAKH
jgi:hypothetical protein